MRAVLRLSQIARTFSSAAGGSKASTTSAPKTADPLKNVSGLTNNCLDKAMCDKKAVPGTGTEYKSPEYFSYSNTSYAEAEVEMEKFRIAQPSSVK
ncbi:unnamed protein product [Diamesa hyperborea]